MSKKFTLSRFGVMLAFLGVLITIGSAVLNVSYDIAWFESVMYFGIVILFSPLAMFQFLLTAGLAGPQITAIDFKKAWLWFFYVIFFIVDTFLFFGVNMIFGFIPKFKNEYFLFSSNNFLSITPWVAIIFLVILIAGLSYRLAALRKVKLA